MPSRMSSRTFLPKPGGRDRPDRKRAMRGVESVECPAWTGPHELTNDSAANTYCAHCGEWWWVLDGEINAREASWLD